MVKSQELRVPTEEKVRMSEMRIKAFNVFSETFEPTLNTIYYPGSNTDISPSKTASFQGSRIIYVDRNEDAIQALQKEGCEAYAEDAKNFNPGKVDLVLLLNFYDEEPLKYVVKNGHVICNEHWKEKAFTKILKKKDFEFVGALVDTNGVVRLDTENLNNYSAAPNRNRGRIENLFVFRKK